MLFYTAESNTGIDSGFDLDNNGEATGRGNDAFGFGNFPGQYGMVLLSKYPIVEEQVRTFQTFLWKDMPGALLPDDPATPEPNDWYSAEELAVFRLSSKSHWDIPVDFGDRVVHFLASHPTPPVFDGAEDRNGTRNHDEIRFWADYIDPDQSAYIYDDGGESGGLAGGASFVILGDLNADPNDGDSTNNAIDQLLSHPLVSTDVVPSSPGGAEHNDGGNEQTGDPAEDTAIFNLRADYILHDAAGLRTRDAQIFWPVSSDVRARTVAMASDHRLVYLDLDYRSVSAFTLQVLHSSDNESSFQEPNTLENKILGYGAILNGLTTLADSEAIPSIYVTAGDHTLPGPFYQAGEEVFGSPGLVDIAFYNAMGLTANGMGNHEFDGGIDEFASMVSQSMYPFLSVNLDFSNVEVSSDTLPIEIGVDGASVEENRGKVAASSYVEVDGERIGLIGRAPADFFNVVNNPDETLPGLDFIGGRNPEDNQPLVSAVELVLAQVEILQNNGVNKIILLDHAQDFTGDPLLAEALSGIDIIVSAGSTGFLADSTPDGPFNSLRAGDSANGDYPQTLTDKDGLPVLIVNTEQLYRYLGNLIVGFDEDGVIDFVDRRSGPVATDPAGVALLAEELGQEELIASPDVEEIWTMVENSALIQEHFTVVGTTDIFLNGARADIRTRETNLGRIVADSTLWFAQEFLDGQGVDLQVDVALKNGGGIRDSVAGPNITKLVVGAVLAFDNKLAVLELSAAEMLAVMENAVSRFPARDGRFPQVAGMEFEFDRNRPGLSDQTRLLQPSRIGNLTIQRANGDVDVLVRNFELLGDPDRTFVIATNDFLLSGGDGYRALQMAGADPDREVYKTDLGEQEILSRYIADVLGGTVEDEDGAARRIGQFSSGQRGAVHLAEGFDESSAEIVDYCPVAERFFVVNANVNGIDVLDGHDPDQLTFVDHIGDLGGEPNSLAVKNGLLAVAVANDDGLSPGWVVFYDTVQLSEINRVQAGVLPDMVTFTPDGRHVLTANEGEPNDENTIDPEGSVSIVPIGNGTLREVFQLTDADVKHGGFTQLSEIVFLKDILRSSGIRFFGEIYDEEGNFLRETTIAEDLEPEYIAVTPDSSKAYVICQENNAFAVFDVETAALIDLIPLGFKDHSLSGNGMDASDRDGGINIQTWPVMGMYQPDSIAFFEAVGQNFIISANEGDARDYDGFSEEVRVDDLKLDPEAYPDAAELQRSSNLGRLKTTTTMGDYDGDGDYDQIFSYGARSFSIWNEDGELVFDSGDAIEQILAERVPEFFNASNDNNRFDNRSDDKGPEPEGVTVGVIDGRTYAFLGLERVGGFMIFDITFPTSPTFIDYVIGRDFGLDPEDNPETVGDLGPEGLKFLDPEDSPTGTPVLVTANEVSGTTTIYEIVIPPTPGFQLQIVHSSDNESAFQDPNTLEPKILGYATVIEGLKDLAVKERRNLLHLTAGDHTLPGLFYQASAEVDELGQPGLADIAFYNAMGLTANGIGNHEFDGGIDEFAHMLNAADYPFIAANLDFSGVMTGDEAPTIEIGEDGGSVIENAGKVVKSAYVEVGGEKIGLIGRAPADFFNVIEDPETNLPGLDFVGGRDEATNQPLVSAVNQVLEQVELLESKGINKIILLDHAQDFTGDPLSASSLRGIDIIVAAGSTGFMANEQGEGPFNFLREGDVPEAAYPTVRTDAEDFPVLVVNSDQLYTYVGNLMVNFDREGHILTIDDRSGPIATNEEGIALLEAELGKKLSPPEEVSRLFVLLQETELIESQLEVVGTTATELVGLRAEVRSRETNLGRLAADSTLWFANQYAEEEGLGYDVDIALKNGGGIRSTILGPNITRLTIGAALAFNNRLAIIELNAAELIAAMENAVSRNPALDGRFPQVAGVVLEFDPSMPGVSDQLTLDTPSRVKRLVVGEDIIVDGFVAQGDLSRTFHLATNSFLLTGGDGYQVFAAINDDPDRKVVAPDTGEQEILASYISDALEGVVDLPEPLADPRVILSTGGEAMPAALTLGYGEWSRHRFAPDEIGRGMHDDFDGNGESNLFAFAFDLDPRQVLADSQNRPRVILDENHVIIRYRRIDNPSLDYACECSSDLRSWETMQSGSEFSEESVSNGDGTSNVTLRIPILDEDAGFYRIHVRVGG
ncbi:MAG: choice-of-anchor I family protein [Verrucomicrobiota bacterium]